MKKDTQKISAMAEVIGVQSNMDDWLIIEKIEDVVIGKSIPYNYENSKV